MGDGAGIAGADAAEGSGERAALALLEDRGLAVDKAKAARLERELAKIARFRELLERAFPFPAHWIGQCADDTVLCRLAAAELLASATNRPVSEGGRLRAQAPIKPIPLVPADKIDQTALRG